MSGAAKRTGPWRSAGRPSGTAAVGGAGGPQGRYAGCGGPVSGRVVCRAGLCGLVGGPGGRSWPTGRAGSSGRRRPTHARSGGLARWWPQCHYRLGRGWDGRGALSSQATAWRGRGRWLALATLGPLAKFLMAVGRGAAGRGSVAGAGSVRGQHRVPGPADRDLLARQPRVLRVRRGVGWRGYRQPTLEQRCPVLGAAAAILSVIWALWHLPLFGRRWASLATRPPTPSSRPLSTIIVVRIATDDHPPNPPDTERV